MPYSLSKTLISEEAARAVAACHFGSNHGLRSFTELKDGMFNTAALLELEDGLKCVLKAAPPEDVTVLAYERDIMRAEVEAMQLVRERVEGIPVPQLYAYDTTRSLLPSSYFLMEFLPGTPLQRLRPSLSPQAQAQIEREMGCLASAIASVTGPAFGYWAQPEPPGTSWRTCFTHMLQGVIADGMAIDVRMPMPYADIFQLAEAHFDALDAVRVPRMVHWDIWDGNVFVDPQTLRVTGLIDFERAMWADPLIEAIFGRLSADTEYVRGFGAPLFQTPAEYSRRALYNLYLFLIMTIECYYRKFENQNQENWARARLDETIGWLSENAARVKA